jgi:N-acetylneuraminate lyase/4-hydroxy-tetrahydrodipicolinate synthase
MPMFEGVVATLITPFDEKEEVFEDGLIALIDFLASRGIRNIFCLGSWGGFALMTAAERMRVAQVCLKEAKGHGLKVIVNISSPSTKEALRLAQHAQDCQADAVASLVPYYYASSAYRTANILQYFAALTAQVAIPVHFYNNPRTTGFQLTPSLLHELINIGVRGIKEGGGNLTGFIDLLDTVRRSRVDFDFIPGSGSMLTPALLYGVSAVMMGTSVVFPEIALEAFQACRQGDWTEGVTLHQKIMELRRIQGLRGMGAAACYGLLRLRGVNAGYPRGPWTWIMPQELMETNVTI